VEAYVGTDVMVDILLKLGLFIIKKVLLLEDFIIQKIHVNLTVYPLVTIIHKANMALVENCKRPQNARLNAFLNIQIHTQMINGQHHLFIFYQLKFQKYNHK
jgi:hypothetical protein